MSLESISERKITPEEIDQLLRKANEIETKYLLLLELEGRTGGCGYLYTYDSEVEIIHGKAELVTLEREYINECEWRKRLLVIPYTVSTVVVKKYRDKNPEVPNRDTFYIFTSEGWKSLEVEVPK